MGSPRYVKVAEQIHVIVAEMLERRIKDPRLGFVTITDVRITGDGRDATVFYTVLGDEQSRIDTAHALESARGLIRSTVGKQLGMKFSPTIAFTMDAVPETAKHIEDALARARMSDEAVAAQAVTTSYAGDADPYKHDDEDESEQ